MEKISNIPKCVGIILDGNRRWARDNGLPVFEGHRRGMNNVEPIVLNARDLGIEHVIVYAFSTENWNRSADEVSFLMKIFEDMAKQSLSRLVKEGVGVRFIGQRERFSKNLQNAMSGAEEKSPKNPKTTLWVCLSYGGRADIVQAANALVAEEKLISEESLNDHLWTVGMPDPDIIIRTGGEHRLSNFLLWQATYSELFFLKVYWPAFTEKDFKTVIKEYATRERRIGK